MFNQFGQNQQQPQQQTTSAFGSFGSQPNVAQTQPQNPAFGSVQPFQQQQTSFGFGQPSQTTSFGAPSGSAFGSSNVGFSTGSTTGLNPAFSGAPTFNNTLQNKPFSSFNQSAPTTSFGQTPAPSPFSNPSTTFNQPATTGFGTASSFGSQPQSGFGSNTTSSLGQSAITPFGGQNQSTVTSDNANCGTGNPNYQSTHDRETSGTTSSISIFHSITCMNAYKKWSFEELRAQDYIMGKKTSSNQSTSFGAATPTAFGQPTTTTTFGQAASTSTFGQPSSTFGQPTSTFGQPGATSTFGSTFNPTQPTTGGLFATSNTVSNPSPFGQTNPVQPQTTGFGFPQQQQPTTSTAFATTTPSAFGSQPTFNQAPPTGFGGFGQPVTQPQASNTNMFGQPAQSTTSLFGKPATTTGMFGQPPAPTSTNSLFGQPPSNPTPFNQPSTTPSFGQTVPSTGIFGATNSTAPSTNIFNKPAGGFGFNAPTTATPNSLFPTSTVGQSAPLFGSMPQTNSNNLATNNLFSAKPVTTNLFGNPPSTTMPSTNFFGTNLGGSGIFATQQTQNQSNLQASIDKNPYGNNPLFNIPVTSSTLSKKETPLAIPVKSAEMKTPVLPPHFAITPKSASKLKLRNFTPTSINSIKPATFIETLPERNVGALALEASFTPRRNMKRLNLDENGRIENATFNSSQTCSIVNTLSTPRAVSFDNRLELESAKKTVTNIDFIHSKTETPSQSKNGSPSFFNQNTPFIPDTPSPSNFLEPSPQKPEYVLSPPLSELLELSDEELKQVSNFEVSIEGLGSVRFLKPVDLLSVTGDRRGVKNIPGNIVIISKKTVQVYSDETDDKPPAGQGLNQPAEIKLYGCWAFDKHTKQPIKDESDPAYDRHLQRLENFKDTKYIGFHSQTGCWRFRVEHFSKYGLDDDDSEPTEKEPIKNHQLDLPKVANKQNQLEPKGLDESGSFHIEDSFAHVKKRIQMHKIHDEEETIDESESNIYESSLSESDLFTNDEESDESEESSNEESDLPSSRQIQNSSHLHNPKMSNELDRGTYTPSKPFFTTRHPTDTTESSCKFVTPDKRSYSHVGSPVLGSFKKTLVSNARIGDHIDKIEDNKKDPVDLSIKNNPITNISKPMPSIPYIPILKRSIFSKNKDDPSNILLNQCRSFRVGWSPNGQIAVCRPSTIQQGKFLELSNVTIWRLDSAEASAARYKADTLLSEILDAVQKTATHRQFNDPSSEFKINIRFQTLERLLDPITPSSLGQTSVGEDRFSKHEIEIWKLCSILFDKPIRYEMQMQSTFNRELDILEKVSAWLKDSISHIFIKQPLTPVQSIFTYLTHREIEKAITVALQHKMYRLALIISQINGTSSKVAIIPNSTHLSSHGLSGICGADRQMMNNIRRQLNVWETQHTEWSINSANPDLANSIIPQDVLICWNLLAGDYSRFSRTYFENVGWKTTFGLFLWYVNGGWDSLSASFNNYKSEMIAHEYVAYPLPRYIEHLDQQDKKTLINNLFRRTQSNVIPKDICFHLFLIYCNGDSKNTSLLEALKPENMGNDLLDYRIAWIIYFVMTNSFTSDQLVNIHSNKLEYDAVVGDKLTISFIYQLERIGHYVWGIFVARFLSQSDSREQMIRYLLNSHYPLVFHLNSCVYRSALKTELPTLIQQKAFDFLVNKLQVPQNWIVEALIIKARYSGDMYLEFCGMVDLGSNTSAHEFALTFLLPPSYLKCDYDLLSGLLTLIDHDAVLDWAYGGSIILEFIDLYRRHERTENMESITQSWKEDILKTMGKITDFCENHNPVSCIQLAQVLRKYGRDVADRLELTLIDMNKKLYGIFAAYEKVLLSRKHESKIKEINPDRETELFEMDKINALPFGTRFLHSAKTVTEQLNRCLCK